MASRRDFLKVAPMLGALFGTTIYFPNIFVQNYKYVMLLGDSELYGYPLAVDNPCTTRAYLRHQAPEWAHIGTQPDFQECYCGKRTDELRALLPTIVSSNRVPDMVIINAGTNDILQSRGYRLAQIVSDLRGVYPLARIVVTRLFGPRYMHTETAAYNATYVDPINAEKVDLSAMPVEYYWQDNLHPSLDGQQWMGQQYINQLHIGVGA